MKISKLLVLAFYLGLSHATSYYGNQCSGFYKTGTQGDWSQCSPNYNYNYNNNNNNPYACMKNYYYKDVFPYGMSVGCSYGYGGYYMQWTDPYKLSDYMPQICWPRVLKYNYYNPGKWITDNYGRQDSAGGILGGEIAALTLNMKFDEKYNWFNDKNYCKLKDLYVCSKNSYKYYDNSYYNQDYDCNYSSQYWPNRNYWYCSDKFYGKTISEILSIANSVIGGCCYDSDYYKCPSKEEMTSCVKYINHAFSGGGRYINDNSFYGVFSEYQCPKYY